jgi:phosphatidylserine/phosphatidylglycerophosphate/cardiolipin synthase-like enzyme
VFYLAVGSFNQNYRSMLMDGEVLFLVSGPDASMAFLDFVGMVYVVTWVDTVEELEEVLPSTEGIKRWISRYIKRAV